VFPNAALVSLIDRLVHRCEIVAISEVGRTGSSARRVQEKEGGSRRCLPKQNTMTAHKLVEWDSDHRKG
jgi:hypothetical protein